MVNFIAESHKFIKKHFLDILLVSLFLLIGLIYIVLNNIHLKTNDEFKRATQQVIIVEGMENNDDTPNLDICSKYKGDSIETEKHCSTLEEGVCKFSGCCVLAGNGSTKKCVAGDSTGPTYQSDDDGNPLNFDYYYYKNKCYGAECPETL